MRFLKTSALLVFVVLLCTSCYVGVPAERPAPYYPGPYYYPYAAPYYYPYPEPYYAGPGLGFYFDVPGIVIGGGHHHRGYWRH